MTQTHNKEEAPMWHIFREKDSNAVIAQHIDSGKAITFDSMDEAAALAQAIARAMAIGAGTVVPEASEQWLILRDAVSFANVYNPDQFPVDWDNERMPWHQQGLAQRIRRQVADGGIRSKENPADAARPLLSMSDLLRWMTNTARGPYSKSE